MLTALLIIARSAHIGASILIAGTFTFQVVTLGSSGSPVSEDLREVEQHLLRLACWSLVAALLSAVLWFWLEVANMSELPLTDTFSATAWRAVLFETEFGRVWMLRLGLIVAAFVFAVSRLPRIEGRRRSLILVL
jgi:putative copper export protein